MTEHGKKLQTVICLSGLIMMVGAMVIGPLFSPPEFDWVRHTTSEQAGQNMPGAWIMRTGFSAYGASVVACCLLDRNTRPLVRFSLAVFGLGLVATAIWSNAPISQGLPSNIQEDSWHSLASWIVGIAFIAACLARLFAPGGSRKDLLAWIGLAISVSVPMLMAVAPDVRGALQRVMFAFSLVFIVREFAVLRRSPPSSPIRS